ncbi:LysR substrate-binding domain-containing protein [Cupriavidus basilensis]|uniref:LysR substrate-binding domain-containing protein n=1 Tax=Cupriavidus basilensis TaxID=68895 RepID=UPI0007519A22|nr:LysR substrate-binding domain-containing protein [Cupriavidus basilensis]
MAEESERFPADASATLDLILLRAFVEVERQGTFHAAASALHCTQSAISQRMQKLEQLIGQPLFLRTGRSKVLTDTGRHLLRYGQEMLALHDDAMAFLQARSPRGSLRLGSSHDAAEALLPMILAQLSRLMPHLSYEVTIGRSPELLKNLHDAGLDLALATRRDDALESFVVRSAPVLWLCSANFKFARGEPLPLVLGDEPSVFRRFALEALARHGQPWRQIYTSSSPVGVRAAVRAGLGITPRTVEMLTPDMRILGDREGLPQMPDVSYYLYCRQNSVNPVVSQAFQMLRLFFRHQDAGAIA